MEAAIKAVKYLILKNSPSGEINCKDYGRELLELTITLNTAGRSHVQIFYGHPLCTCVPAHPMAFMDEWQTQIEDYDPDILPSKPTKA